MAKKTISLDKWQWQELKPILEEARRRESDKLETMNAKALMTHQTDEAKLEAVLMRLSVLRAILGKI